MTDFGLASRIGQVVGGGAGLGLIAGGCEFLVLTTRDGLGGSTLEAAGLALAIGGVMTLFGAVVSVAVSSILPVMGGMKASRAVPACIMVIGFLLCGFHFWQAAWEFHLAGQSRAGLALAAIPLGFTGMIYFNARFLIRRKEQQLPAPPWSAVCLTLTGLLMVAGLAVHALRDTGGALALEGDKNVVWVTFSQASTIDTPADVVFTDAVTLAPADRPAAAVLHTGLHPLRTDVLFADDQLPRNRQTVSEVLRNEGYATAAFVSTNTLSEQSGLAQGFHVYDDDVSPFYGRLHRTRLGRNLLQGRPAQRSSMDTLHRFERWLERKDDVPFFAWIHLERPDSEALGRIDQLLAPLQDQTMVVFTAMSGVPGRPDGVLYDDRIQVPLSMRLPGIDVRVPEVDNQLSHINLLQTVTTYLAMEVHRNEGLPLTDWAVGDRRISLGATLVGRTDDGRVQAGLRNNGVKAITDPSGETYELYRLEDDPDEQRDLAASQPETLDQVRGVLASDLIDLRESVP